MQTSKRNQPLALTLIIAAVVVVTGSGIFILQEQQTDSALQQQHADSASLSEASRTPPRNQQSELETNSVERPAPLSFDTAPAVENNNEEPRGYNRLRPDVMAIIEEVQERQLQDQMEEALNELNALYQRFDELNPFEQQTVLNFYTNTLIALEMYQETITAFSLMLTIPELDATTETRAIRSLGQLHGAVGEPEAAVYYLTQWLERVEGEPGNERRIELAQRQIEAFSNGVSLTTP